MSGVLQMDADLMLAAGEKPHVHQGGPVPHAPSDPDVGLRALAPRVHHHIGVSPPERRLQHPEVRRPLPRDDRQVVPFDLLLPIAQHLVEMTQHRRGLGKDQDPGGVAVEPVAQLETGQVGAEESQRLDDAGGHIRASVHGHPGGLVHHQ